MANKNIKKMVKDAIKRLKKNQQFILAFQYQHEADECYRYLDKYQVHPLQYECFTKAGSGEGYFFCFNRADLYEALENNKSIYHY